MLLILTVLFISFSQADTVEAQRVTPAIENAIVYLNGAQVTHTAEVQLKEGPNTLVFEHLPSRLNEKSIQITASQPITILSVRKAIGDDFPSTAQLDSLQLQKQQLENELQLKKAEETILQRELDILLSNKKLGGESQKITADEIRQAMDFFREKLKEIETSRIEVSNRIEEINQNLSEINQQINVIRSNQKKKAGQIIAEIESARQQSPTLGISYIIANAGWYPSYDVRVHDTDQPLNLTYKANIYQNSGIDWNNVHLSVSSAQPLIPSQIPDIPPVYLRFRQPELQERYKDVSVAPELRRAEEAIAPSGQALASPETPAVSVSQNQTSFSFNIEQPYTVSGDGTAKTVAMQQHSLDASYRYMAIPKIRPTAYLTAMVTGWEPHNLLAGRMNLYFDQTFIGQSRLQPETPGDTLQFSLGKDDRIILERNRLQEFTEKNFFGNRVREISAWELTVRNTKDQPITLNLVDQIPVSTHEDIEVDLLESSGASYQSQTGRLSWELQMAGASSAQRVFRYRIQYPSGKELNQR